MMETAQALGWFVTGTDTGVGKTWVSLALLRALCYAGYRAAGMKPVASGCELRQRGAAPVNRDALQLQAHSMSGLDYALVNPFVAESPGGQALESAGQTLLRGLERYGLLQSHGT